MSKREQDLEKGFSRAITVGNEMLERACQLEKYGEELKKNNEQFSDDWKYGVWFSMIADEMKHFYSRMFA